MTQREEFKKLPKPKRIDLVLEDCRRILREGVKDPAKTAIGGNFDGRYLFPGIAAEFAVADGFAPYDCRRVKREGYDLTVGTQKVEVKAAKGFDERPDEGDHVFIDCGKVKNKAGEDIIKWDYIIFTRPVFGKLYDYHQDGKPLLTVAEYWAALSETLSVSDLWARQAQELQSVMVLGYLTADRFRELYEGAPASGVLHLKKGDHGMRSHGQTYAAKGDAYHIPIRFLDPL